MFVATVFTLYPDLFPGPFSEGLYGKALEKKNMEFTKSKHKRLCRRQT